MLGSLVLVGGSLGDLFGRRPVFTWGVIGFGVTSLLCAMAPSGRAADRRAGAAGRRGRAARPVVAGDHHEHVRRGRAGGGDRLLDGVDERGDRGRPSRSAGSSSTSMSWRVVFALNVPLVVGCLWFTKRAMPLCAGEGGRHVDVVGGLLCALGLGGPVYALIQQPVAGWGAPEVRRRPGRRRARAGRVRGLGVAPPGPDAAARRLPRAQLRGRQPRDARGLRGPRLGDVLPRAVPPAGRRLRRARRGPVADAAHADHDPGRAALRCAERAGRAAAADGARADRSAGSGSCCSCASTSARTTSARCCPASSCSASGWR